MALPETALEYYRQQKLTAHECMKDSRLLLILQCSLLCCRPVKLLLDDSSHEVQAVMAGFMSAVPAEFKIAMEDQLVYSYLNCCQT